MESLQNFIMEAYDNQAAETVFRVASKYNFDFNLTATEITSNFEWYTTVADRMTTTRGNKYLSTLHDLTTDINEFNKVIDKLKKQQLKQEKNNLAKAASKKEALKDLLSLGNKELKVIIKQGSTEKKYYLSINDDGNIVLE